MNFLEYLVISIARATFEATASTWFFQLSLYSIWAPKYFNRRNFAQLAPPIHKFCHVICLVPMCIDVVLVTFNNSLLPCRHSSRFSSSEFITLTMSLMCASTVTRACEPFLRICIDRFENSSLFRVSHFHRQRWCHHLKHHRSCDPD